MEIYFFGYNGDGRLGLNNKNNQYKPTYLMNDPQIIFLNQIRNIGLKWSVENHFVRKTEKNVT